MDKPTVQFKMNVPDHDALRDLIKQAHARLVAEMPTPHSFKDQEQQKAFYRVEKLADFFSVELTKRYAT